MPSGAAFGAGRRFVDVMALSIFTRFLAKG